MFQTQGTSALSGECFTNHYVRTVILLDLITEILTKSPATSISDEYTHKCFALMSSLVMCDYMTNDENNKGMHWFILSTIISSCSHDLAKLNFHKNHAAAFMMSQFTQTNMSRVAAFYTWETDARQPMDPQAISCRLLNALLLQSTISLNMFCFEKEF